MNLFEKILYILQTDMNVPTAFGGYHLMCIGIMITLILYLYQKRNKYNEKQLKKVLFTYGSITLILEILKQLIWSFNYDGNIVTWDYEWYAFPFQLCTTPVYVSLICCFLKKNKLRDSLLSYIAFVTILGSISTILIPTSCFTSDILVNIHTMVLHLGSFVVSLYLMINNEVECKLDNLKSAIKVFLIFVMIAYFMNISVYELNILGDETFNMFYISPYFISALPVFDVIQQNVPYIFFLLTYILAIIIGATIIYQIYYQISIGRYMKYKPYIKYVIFVLLILGMFSLLNNHNERMIHDQIIICFERFD